MRAFTDPTEVRFKSEEQAQLRAFWAVYDPHREAVSQTLLEAIRKLPDFKAALETYSPEQSREQDRRTRELQRLGIEEGDWDPFIEDLHATGAQYARMGVRFGAWFSLLSIFRDAMRARLIEAAAGDLDETLLAGNGMNLFIDFSMALLGEAYLDAKEQIIRDQQQAIRELSIPVLQVHDRLLIIPVVGMVDTQRARHLTEALLKAIRANRALAVVMDITGVPIVDSKVANHLVQACEAARLMGAKVILTGISSEIAQALVMIGAELREVRTVGDLQTGIEEAEALLGFRTIRGVTTAAVSPAPEPPAPTDSVP